MVDTETFTVVALDSKGVRYSGQSTGVSFSSLRNTRLVSEAIVSAQMSCSLYPSVLKGSTALFPSVSKSHT